MNNLNRRTPQHRKRRRGATLFELMVAATLLVSGVGVAAPLTVRSGRLWQQTRHQQMALDELTNQMEILIDLPIEQLENQLDKVAVSEAASTLLADAVLTAEIVGHENESELRLSINWNRVGSPEPLTLTGWLKAESIQ